jgi:prepilin-type processing-associated H-X9-DG protein
MDYAAAQPAPTRHQRFPTLSSYPFANPDTTSEPSQNWGTVGCGEQGFWGDSGGSLRFEIPDLNGALPGVLSKKAYYGYWGVIVRSNYCFACTKPEAQQTGFYTPIGFQQIEDGSSNTLVIGEKRLRPSEYDFGAWFDDKGWSDGWDPDTLRYSICPLKQDDDDPSPGLAYSFGAAHPGGMNSGFADGSGRSIKYDIDLELFNNLAHRADGDVVDTSSL